MHPSTSAPAGRLQNGGSVTASASNDSDDDEASSSFNITNRCSPKSVFLLVAKFSEFKKQLIRDSGFGGIIDIPCIRKLNLKLSSWLLSKLDTEESCLVFGPSRSIYIHEADVGIVLGIPNGEIDISTTSVTDEQLELLRSSIGLAGSDVRSIKGIDYVLEKHLDDQSSSQEVDSFKVAFVVFIIAHLLAPCVKHDQVQLDFWGALKNPSTLDRFNWCRYVYGHLLEAAQKARAETINKGRCTSLLGCHYFLQVCVLRFSANVIIKWFALLLCLVPCRSSSLTTLIFLDLISLIMSFPVLRCLIKNLCGRWQLCVPAAENKISRSLSRHAL